jgi:hypothetical protein
VYAVDNQIIHKFIRQVRKSAMLVLKLPRNELRTLTHFCSLVHAILKAMRETLGEAMDFNTTTSWRFVLSRHFPD